MEIASDVPKRPAFRYFGGKWRLAPWILGFFPRHYSYVDLCGGAASVLLMKPRSQVETYNDQEEGIVNFFTVLRERTEELIRVIQLTPWARDEYDLSFNPDDDPIEKARRFYIRQQMSIAASPERASYGWRIITKSDGDVAKKFDNLYSLMWIAKRLKGVQIENRDYKDVISRFDRKDALFYFDPPYVASTRKRKKGYLLEWSDEDHMEAAWILQRVSAMVAISGYNCDLYRSLYEEAGWRRHEREALANSKSKKMESVWLSPNVTKALVSATQINMVF